MQSIWLEQHPGSGTDKIKIKITHFLGRPGAPIQVRIQILIPTLCALVSITSPYFTCYPDPSGAMLGHCLTKTGIFDGLP